jgi:hypothetical protein
VAPGGFISNNDDFPNTLGIENRLKREVGHAFASNITNTQIALGSLGIRIVEFRIVRLSIANFDTFTGRLIAER